MNNRVIKIIFIISGSFLAGILAIKDGLIYMVIGMLLSLIIYSIILFKLGKFTDLGNNFGCKKEVISLTWAVASVYICTLSMTPYIKKEIVVHFNISSVNDGQVGAMVTILIIPYFYLLYREFIHILNTKIRIFYNSFSKIELLFFWVHIVLISVLMIFLYQKTSAFSYAYFVNENGDIVTQSANAILNTDSSLLLKRTFTMENMGDIRHPLWIIIQLPITSIALIASYLLPFGTLVYPVFQCILINFCLTSCIILLERLVEVKWTLFIFGISFPFILYGLLFETSQIAMCLCVLTIYIICKQKSESNITSFLVAAASGYTLTSCLLAIFTEEIRNIKVYIKEIIKCAISFFALCIVWGQSYVIVHFSQAIEEMLTTYNGTSKYTIIDRLVAFTHSMAATFIAIPWNYYEEPRAQYHYFSFYITFWNNETKINWFGVVVLCLAVLGILWNYQNKFARICFIWLIYHFVIFVLIGYSSGDFTVHAMLYSWAVVSLVIMAMQKILNKFQRLNSNVVITILICFILYKNLVFLVDIYQYAVTCFPILSNL